MTNSPTPGCAAGDCDSDHWSSVAELVDDSLYVIYIEDKDAGGIPFNEGTFTTNPVKYLSYLNPAPSGINDNGSLPTVFTLTQNYPNPFNAKTTIKYSLQEPSDVVLEIYDILGRKVEDIVEGEKSAGEHQIVWNAEDKPSSVYYYRIKVGEYAETRKMVLLK
jgi:hypothetical protein